MKYLSLAKGIPAVMLLALCHASGAEAAFKLNFDEAGNGSYQVYNGTDYDAAVNDPGVFVNGFLSYLLPESVTTGTGTINDADGISDILNFIQSGDSFYLQFISQPGPELADSDTFPDGFSGSILAYEDEFGNFTYVAGVNDPAVANFYYGHSGDSGVPEPSTWAMILLGFGMVGFGLRDRRKPTVRVTYA